VSGDVIGVDTLVGDLSESSAEPDDLDEIEELLLLFVG
jgi:hypothetical protein